MTVNLLCSMRLKRFLRRTDCRGSAAPLYTSCLWTYSGLELTWDHSHNEGDAGGCGWGENILGELGCFHCNADLSLSQAMVHSSHHCAVCMQFVRKENLLSLACQHQFCRSCWEQHCTVLVKDGVGVGEFKADMVLGLYLPCWPFWWWLAELV